LRRNSDGGFGDHITSNVEKVLPLLRQLRGNLRHMLFFHDAECTLSLTILKQLES
jgi:hypothetical protein